MAAVIRSALYRGHLMHARRDGHAVRRFRYPVFMACLDPDELPVLAARLRGFAYNRPGLFSLRDRDYRGAAEVGVAAAHRAALATAGLPTPHQVRLVTNLRTAGYVFNPVSFFLDYDASGAVTTAIAEVNNTYGGNHPYLLHDGNRQPSAGPGDPFTTFRVERTFFVSPFLHGPALYRFRFDAPLDGASLDVRMDVVQDRARVLLAHLRGTRVALSDANLVRLAVRFPLMSAQVVALIYYEALRMHLARVPYRRPGPDHRPAPAVPPAPARRRDAR